ncbi:MAG: Efflux pump periplasmic linker BepF [Firmicutes bacterium ADurb.Bin456]|nr:MAG: Efflux pump periplasmic linker BepF [Firmicutes bacterium ADurb.Bin456]
MFETKIRLANPGCLLKPGMYAGVEIKSGETEEVLVVPQNAVISVEGLYFVFIAEGDRARRQQVETGRVIDQSVEIKSGITEGEQVIVTNINKLKDQDRIAIADSQQQEA